MIASVIPKIPKKFPVLDVSGEERPRNAIMNNMPVTNAISSVIIVGALVAVGLSPITQGFFGKFPGILGILLASINIFGGFLVTHRMLKMYKKNKKK